jgi:acetoin utilization protein AcuB
MGAAEAAVLVGDVMSSRVETVSPDDSLEAAWNRMQLRHIRHLVVVREERVVGILSDRDLGILAGDTLRRGLIVADVMTPEVVGTSVGVSVSAAAALLRRRKIDALPVLEKGALRGIITTADLLEFLEKGTASTRSRRTQRGRKARVRTERSRIRPAKRKARRRRAQKR